MSDYLIPILLALVLLALANLYRAVRSVERELRRFNRHVQNLTCAANGISDSIDRQPPVFVLAGRFVESRNPRNN